MNIFKSISRKLFPVTRDEAVEELFPAGSSNARQCEKLENLVNGLLPRLLYGLDAESIEISIDQATGISIVYKKDRELFFNIFGTPILKCPEKGAEVLTPSKALNDKIAKAVKLNDDGSITIGDFILFLGLNKEDQEKAKEGLLTELYKVSLEAESVYHDRF